MILEELRQKGIKVTLIDNNHIAVEPKEKVTKDILLRLKAEKLKIIKLLRQENEKRLCKGYTPPRYVIIPVCEWHIKEADPHCINCQYLNSHDKEVWMNAYLDKAIRHLNSYCKETRGIKWDEVNKRLLKDVEQKITETFLRHDIITFKKMVDKWKSLLKA